VHLVKLAALLSNGAEANQVTNSLIGRGRLTPPSSDALKGNMKEYLQSCGLEEAKDMIGFIEQIKAYKAYVLARRRAEIKRTLEECKEQRSLNLLSSNGWNKDKTLKAKAKIPQWMIFDEEYGKYFDPEIPVEDRAKEKEKLLKRLDKEYGNFRVS